ncbi:hypothetical protein PFISCL1PPCAC_16738 [Pristionchus fissidentatus]|uniref:ADP ribosylation factor n=1 Tax=Pristionchus fissidentatus TaxID=1538716 RepID=A0AAV5W041_9BILA|nr:hypothetical protein PFISCL1PPCAC_16738 [Pristionchus fissidentatus]
MGQLFSSLMRLVNSPKHLRIVMLGLDGAGKTTILFRLKLGELINTISTIGFNVEQVTFRNLILTIWDIGGQQKSRPLWKYYFQNTQALIYVVDSADLHRLDEARDELHSVLDDPEMIGTTVLVYANKQDLPTAISPDELTRRLNLQALKGREWYVQSSNATTAAGLGDGLEWLVGQLK